MSKTKTTIANGALMALKHTGQAVGALVIVATIVWKAGIPAMEQFVKTTMSDKLAGYESKQNYLISNSIEVNTTQQLILEKIEHARKQQRNIRDDLREQNRDIKEILREMRRK